MLGYTFPRIDTEIQARMLSGTTATASSSSDLNEASGANGQQLQECYEDTPVSAKVVSRKERKRRLEEEIRLHKEKRMQNNDDDALRWTQKIRVKKIARSASEVKRARERAELESACVAVKKLLQAEKRKLQDQRTQLHNMQQLQQQRLQVEQGQIRVAQQKQQEQRGDRATNSRVHRQGGRSAVRSKAEIRPRRGDGVDGTLQESNEKDMKDAAAERKAVSYVQHVAAVISSSGALAS